MIPKSVKARGFTVLGFVVRVRQVNKLVCKHFALCKLSGPQEWQTCETLNPKPQTLFPEPSMKL